MTNWKYYLPHLWHRERQVWEDVYLLPDDVNYAGPAVHLTVDALGDANDPLHGSDRASFQREALSKLGDAAFWIDGTDMIVRAVDFSRQELGAWARVWLEQNGFQVGDLREAGEADFTGRCAHADLISELKQRFRDQV